MTAVRITRELAASPDRVWTAFTDPDALAQWFWPAASHTTASLDPRKGGRYRIEASNRNMAVSGEYREVSPPHKLVFTWQWDGEDDQSLVTIEISPHESGTQLAIRHELLASETDRNDHERGWHDCLDRLPGWLASVPQQG
jgi:uncharacterized protein YndB with AHSA1/START domain